MCDDINRPSISDCGTSFLASYSRDFCIVIRKSLNPFHFRDAEFSDVVFSVWQFRIISLVKNAILYGMDAVFNGNEYKCGT